MEKNNIDSVVGSNLSISGGNSVTFPAIPPGLRPDDKADRDPIENPDHYTDVDMDSKDFMKSNFSIEMLIGAYIWNVIKYCARFRKKGTPLQDLKKARTYLNWAIELYEGK